MKQKRIVDFSNIVLYSTMIATNTCGDVLKGIAGEPIETIGGYTMTFKITNAVETQFIKRPLDSSEKNVLKLPNLYGMDTYANESVTVSFVIIEKQCYAVLCCNGDDTAIQHMFPVDFNALVYLPHTIEFNGKKNKNVVIDPMVINDGLGFTIDVSETAMVHITEDREMAAGMQAIGLLPYAPEFKNGKEVPNFENPLADDNGMSAHENRYVNQYVREKRNKNREQIEAIKRDSEDKLNVFPIVFYWKHFNMSCNHRLNDFTFPLFKAE